MRDEEATKREALENEWKQKLETFAAEAQEQIEELEKKHASAIETLVKNYLRLEEQRNLSE